MSWLTPLGATLDGVWARLMNGETAEVRPIVEGTHSHFYIPVPPELTASLARNPRLRRSSAISYLAVAAGLAALENAGVKASPDIAVIAAISSGGVVYTRRFYETIVRKGAASASPLLFPETVYNAPASHLSALLGIDGISYTLVGDSSVGISALRLGQQLLETGQASHCLVVGGEEIDWILCEAYRRWRFVSAEPCIRVFARKPAGTLLAEGAAALVLSREGRFRFRSIHDGVPFFNRAGAARATIQVCSDLGAGEPISLAVASANGAFTDSAEAAALRKTLPGVPLLCPKAALGEALGAGGLIQTVAAALALANKEIPPTPGLTAEPIRNGSLQSVLVSAVGLNHQASGLVLSE